MTAFIHAIALEGVVPSGACRRKSTIKDVYTIIETPIFTADAKDIWREDERGEFCAWLAQSPEAGDVIPGAGGCRKVRWARQGVGKRGGVRVIYFNRLANGVIYLLVIYAKSVRDNIPAHILKAIKEELDHDET
jgi:hypothetical protein